MKQIREFEEQRLAWEKEREALESTTASLQAEIEKFKRDGVKANPKHLEKSNSVDLDCTVRDHHQQQLALMQMIDDLRNDLTKEQEKSQGFERRATEAEIAVADLQAALERQKSQPEPAARMTYGPGLVERLKAGGEFDFNTTLTENTTAAPGWRESIEVLNLEDQNIQLREALNTEKQRVVDMKKAACKRQAEWKEQMAEIVTELQTGQVVQEECMRLKVEVQRAREELKATLEREAASQSEVEKLQLEVMKARAAVKDSEGQIAEKAEEMTIISTVVGDQLVAVEKELTAQTHARSEMVRLFLSHAREPLAIIRAACQEICASGEAGGELWMRHVPPLMDDDPGPDLQQQLVQVVHLLRFTAEVLVARQQKDQIEIQEKVKATVDHLTETGKRWLNTMKAHAANGLGEEDGEPGRRRRSSRD